MKFSNQNGALFGNTQNAVKHPTSKPIDLLEYLIRTYSNVGDLILDNAMGAGSTGVAAIRLKRDFIGMEIDSHFFKIAKDRIFEVYDTVNTQ